MFDVLDSNNDGFISEKELMTNADQLDGQFSKQVLKSIFEESDSNNDNKISK